MRGGSRGGVELPMCVGSCTPSSPLWPSSIRAFRASVRNEEYVRDVIEHRMKREAEEAAEKEREKERAKINPFSVRVDCQYKKVANITC